MFELFLTLVFPVRLFAFHPVACAVVALIFSCCVFLPIASGRMRFGFLLSALSWWAFAYLEYGMSVQTNIRTDLLIFGPIFQVAAYFGIWLMFRWFNKNW
jgi:hypothetical protein